MVLNGSFRLTRKHVAEAFWNAEVESELRTGGVTFKFTEKSDREAFMDEVDRARAKNPYVHTNCSEECRKRGINGPYSTKLNVSM